jgi:hypothetical protein
MNSYNKGIKSETKLTPSAQLQYAYAGSERKMDI